MKPQTIEDQVCSLEQAKQLAELGIKVPALFTWVDTDNMPFIQRLQEKKEIRAAVKSFVCLSSYVDHHIHSSNDQNNKERDENSYPAYTVAELYNMLVDRESAKILTYSLYAIDREKWVTQVKYGFVNSMNIENPFEILRDFAGFTAIADSQAQALAETLILLLRDRSFTAENINKNCIPKDQPQEPTT